MTTTLDIFVIFSCNEECLVAAAGHVVFVEVVGEGVEEVAVNQLLALDVFEVFAGVQVLLLACQEMVDLEFAAASVPVTRIEGVLFI